MCHVKMLIVKYFCHISKVRDTQKDTGTDLLDPEGYLSEKVLSHVALP